MRVLFVSYVFPPVGGAGVQRLTKWVRYLPEFGVTPTVLTAANASAPVRDESLTAEVGPEVEIFRARTLEPDYETKRRIAVAQSSHAPASDGDAARQARTPGFALRMKGRATAEAARRVGALLYPDPQVLWLPGALHSLRVLSRRAFHAAVISAPPFSAFLLLPWLQRVMRVPVVLDYRDEWTTTLRAGHDRPASRFAEGLSHHLESWLVHEARAVTTATDEFRGALLERFPSVDPAKITFLPNGFDPADIPVHLPDPPSDRFVITYAGTVFRLTSLRGFVTALQRLRDRAPERFRQLEVRIYGRVAPAEESIMAEAEGLGVRRFGYVSHAAVLAALAESHVNLCVLDDVEGAPRVYPAKIFELMALGRRCLVLAPPGALERLARRHEMGDVLGPRDVDAIADTLDGYLRRWNQGEFSVAHPVKGIDRYDRRLLARELAGILSRVVSAQSQQQGVSGQSTPAETQIG